jgi:hypothetical protein
MMIQGRDARLNTIIEYLDGDSYFLYDPDGGQHTFALDSPEWFTWLNTLTSFHFKGKLGHFTGRSERKKHGDTYWYAYRKAHRKLFKRYLGTTEKLTRASLENTAMALHEEALGNFPQDQLPNASLKQQQSVTSPGLTVGSLTFEWMDDLLSVKTPGERHYLNRTQTMELLSYLCDQRGTLFRKESR